MKDLIALTLIVLVTLAIPARAADCLAYLAAEDTYNKAIVAANAARNESVAAAKATRDQAVAAALERIRKAVAEAKSAYEGAAGPVIAALRATTDEAKASRDATVAAAEDAYRTAAQEAEDAYARTVGPVATALIDAKSEAGAIRDTMITDAKNQFRGNTETGEITFRGAINDAGAIRDQVRAGVLEESRRADSLAKAASTALADAKNRVRMNHERRARVDVDMAIMAAWDGQARARVHLGHGGGPRAYKYSEAVLSASENAMTLARKADAAFAARNATGPPKDRTKTDAFRDAAVLARDAYLELAAVAHPDDEIPRGQVKNLAEVARIASSAYLRAAEIVAVFDKAFFDVQDAADSVTAAEALAAKARTTYHKAAQEAETEYRRASADAKDLFDKAVDDTKVVHDKIISDAGESFRATIAPVESAHNKVVAEAKANYEMTVAEAKVEQDKSIADAEESFRATIAPVESAHDQVVDEAKAVHDEAIARAKATRDNAIADAGVRQISSNAEAARIESEAIETVQVDLGTAWITAYANPGPDSFRNIEGYDPRLVLKIAVAERKECPSL